MFQADKEIIRKAIVVLVIEETLLGMGRPVYDTIIPKLKKEYNCNLPDCYEHPEYLIEILKELYSNAHHTIVKSINEKLEGFSDSKPIARFLEVISK